MLSFEDLYGVQRENWPEGLEDCINEASIMRLYKLKEKNPLEYRDALKIGDFWLNVLLNNKKKREKGNFIKTLTAAAYSIPTIIFSHEGIHALTAYATGAKEFKIKMEKYHVGLGTSEISNPFYRSINFVLPDYILHTAGFALFLNNSKKYKLQKKVLGIGLIASNIESLFSSEGDTQQFVNMLPIPEDKKTMASVSITGASYSLSFLTYKLAKKIRSIYKKEVVLEF